MPVDLELISKRVKFLISANYDSYRNGMFHNLTVDEFKRYLEDVQKYLDNIVGVDFSDSRSLIDRGIEGLTKLKPSNNEELYTFIDFVDSGVFSIIIKEARKNGLPGF